MKQKLNLDIRSSIRISIKNHYIIHIDAMYPVFCNKVVMLHLKDNFELMNYAKVRYTSIFEEKELYIKDNELLDIVDYIYTESQNNERKVLILDSLYNIKTNDSRLTAVNMIKKIKLAMYFKEVKIPIYKRIIMFIKHNLKHVLTRHKQPTLNEN